MAHNRTCVLDKITYRYCPRCEEYKNEPYWKVSFCSANCRTIDHTVNDYIHGLCSKAEAKAILEKCDLSNKDKYPDFVQKRIKEIFATRSKKMEKKEEVAPVVPEEIPVTEVNETIDVKNVVE